ncbi:hypothetical protein GPJ56_001141 [Histomonas meleagridis]|uniref:uncharacterized protein n=1 Tax=Histomonas meleagridis TaxID=135588 RepID=UPI00355A69CF|nr:hypothetical protein GPJ56_001141 [Histomonas meleagridis]KAH0806472.1 hypothetical protein GO595_000634 [Histomonas meleagridis]
MMFPPATRFVVTKDPYDLMCVILDGFDIYKTICRDYIEPEYKPFKVTFVELEEVDEDYGPIIYEEPHTQSPTKTTPKESTPVYTTGFTFEELNSDEYSENYYEDNPEDPEKEEKSGSKKTHIIVVPVLAIILIVIVAFIIYFCRKSTLKDTNTHQSM